MSSTRPGAGDVPNGRAAARVLAWLGLMALLLAARGVPARELSVSYSTWILSGQRVTLRFLLPAAEAQRLTGGAMPLVTVAKLEDYLLGHVDVQASGQRCAVTDQGYDLGRVDPLNAGPGFYGFEIFFRCENPTGIELHDHLLFDRVPGQIDFARIQAGGHVSQQLFTAARQRLAVPATGFVPDAGMGGYIGLGWRHVASSLDRWAFLCGVLLLVRRRRDLGYAIAGLGLGYALSWGQALGGWMVPRLSLLEGFIGFLVALAAVQRLAWERVRPRRVAAASALLLLALALIALPVRGTAPALVLGGAALLAGGGIALGRAGAQRPLFWLLPAAVFGFLDGCVLPAALVPLQLRGRVLAPMLAGFDLGAAGLETGLLLAAAALVWLWRRRWAASPPLPGDLLAAGLGGLGVFWLVSRVYA